MLLRAPIATCCALLAGLALASCDSGSLKGGPDGGDLGGTDGPVVADLPAGIDRGVQRDGGSSADGTPPDGGRVDSAPAVDVSAPPAVFCAERSQAIAAITGNTIVVSPAANGQVTVDGQTKTLRQVISEAQQGDVILLEDGTYTFQESDGSSYTGLYFTRSDVVMRGRSGDRDAVILDSNYADHGSSTAVISVDAPGVVLADFTVKRSIFHLIHLWANGDRARIHNVALVDGGQQFLKASPGSGATVDEVEVTCSAFLMTTAGRDNVWGYGSPTGSTTCYTGGIDTHDARDWLVANNRFEGIYCNAGGVQRPAHGKKGELRDDQTYTGGLSEHAVHMWDSEQGSAHLIERNQIIDCGRGIGVGMATDVYGTIVRNNMVFSRHAASAEHDVGINIERAHDVSVLNNTVFFSSPNAYANAIEYRWDCSGVVIKNNLTNKVIRSRDGAQADSSNNVTNAQASYFVDANNGNLHLASCTLSGIDGAGATLSAVSDDFDGDPRGTNSDVGADQCQP